DGGKVDPEQARHGAAKAVYRLVGVADDDQAIDRKSTRLNSSHGSISHAVFRLLKKKHAQEVHAQLLAPHVRGVQQLDCASANAGLLLVCVAVSDSARAPFGWSEQLQELELRRVDVLELVDEDVLDFPAHLLARLVPRLRELDAPYDQVPLAPGRRRRPRPVD